MKKFIGSLAVLGVIGLAAAWAVTAPVTIPASALAAGYKPDLKNGQTLFDISGCAACHQTAGQKDRLHLGGGLAFATAFGTFHAPNISPDKTNGIGAWSELDFVNAIQRGVGRNGEHLYPALPYTSYAHMKVSDVRDIHAYILTLPADATPSKPHTIAFPYNIRRALGAWKRLYATGGALENDPAHTPSWNRGRYLVEGPGHCAECHSPREAMGGIIADKRFAGGMDAENKGWVPNITQHADGIKSWSADEIAEFLNTGMTPEFDSAGGTMAEVVENTARLTDDDRKAMAEYLKSLPAIPGKAPPKTPSK